GGIAPRGIGEPPRPQCAHRLAFVPYCFELGDQIFVFVKSFMASAIAANNAPRRPSDAREAFLALLACFMILLENFHSPWRAWRASKAAKDATSATYPPVACFCPASQVGHHRRVRSKSCLAGYSR